MGVNAELSRTKPNCVRWPGFRNSFLSLKLDQEMTTSEHLTTWTGFTNEAKKVAGVKGVRTPTSLTLRAVICSRNR